MYLLLGALIAGILVFKKDAVNNVVQDAIVTETDSWTQYDVLFKQYANNYGLDWQWLKAIALNESSLGRASSVARGIENPDDVEGSKSSDGKSWGLMQVTLTTAQSIDPSATPQKLNSPSYSVWIAAQYLNQLRNYIDKYFSSSDPQYLEFLVKSYNEGPGNAIKEINGTGGGFSDEYWSRFQRNLARVQGG